jgi:hypothetical protein
LLWAIERDEVGDDAKQSKGRDQMKCTIVLATAFATALVGAPVVLASSEEDAKTDIAAQVRAQDHPCGTPEKAVRDEALSKPDAAVWILTCDNASYQVRLHPGMAADIEKLE